MSEPLATWIIEFDASGANAVDGALQLVQGQLGTVDTATRETATLTANLLGGTAAQLTSVFGVTKGEVFSKLADIGAATRAGARLMAGVLKDAADESTRSLSAIHSPSFGPLKGPRYEPLPFEMPDMPEAKPIDLPFVTKGQVSTPAPQKIKTKDVLSFEGEAKLPNINFAAPPAVTKSEAVPEIAKPVNSRSEPLPFEVPDIKEAQDLSPGPFMLAPESRRKTEPLPFDVRPDPVSPAPAVSFAPPSTFGLAPDPARVRAMEKARALQEAEAAEMPAHFKAKKPSGIFGFQGQKGQSAEPIPFQEDQPRIPLAGPKEAAPKQGVFDFKDSGLPVEVKAFEGLSQAILKAQKELLATQNTAAGVAAALDFARAKTGDFQDLHKVLGQIDHDFAAGGASAQAAQHAIAGVLDSVNQRVREQKDLVTAQKESAVKGAEDQAKAIRNVGIAYGALSGTMLGWVRAGLQGTAEGERLSFMFQQVSRQVASLFIPIIDGLTFKLQDLTAWFRSLSGGTQDLIARFGLVSAGASAFALAALKLGPALQGVSVAVGGIGKQLVAAFVANPILGVVAGVAALLTTTEKGRESLSHLASAALPAIEKLAGGIAYAADGVAILVDAFASIGDGNFAAVTVAAGAAAAAILWVATATGIVGGAAAAATMDMAALGATAAGAGAAGTAGMLSLATATSTATVAMAGLRAVMTTLMAHPFMLIAASVLSLGVLAKALFGSSAPKAETPRREVAPAGGGVESLEATWERLQSAVNKTDIPNRQLTEAEKTNALLARLIGLQSGILRPTGPISPVGA